jgi:hypothetical protein
MRLSVNGRHVEVSSTDQLCQILATFADEEFREIWLSDPSGSSICALLNRKAGWLMYLREPGDPGFSSRNLSFSGPYGEVIAYRLSNGQIDEYPASWAHSEEVVVQALVYFVEHEAPAPFIAWHDDGG